MGVSAGDIIFIENYQFSDGGVSNKLLIILSSRQNANILAVLVTSQANHRSKNYGCFGYAEYFYIPANTDFFEKNSWVETNRPQEMQQGNYIVKGRIQSNLLKEIIDCQKRSRDITRNQANLLQ